MRYRDEPSGLGGMLGGLIEANLAAHPDRARLLRPATVVALEATDIGESVTLRLARTGVVVARGLVGRPRVVVRAPAQTLVELSNVPLWLGLPDPRTPEGRAALRKLRTRQLRVSGMLRHPSVLSRLNRLLSVR